MHQHVFQQALVLCASVIVACCGQPQESAALRLNGESSSAALLPQTHQDGTAILASTLSALNLSNPVADLDANLSRGDRRLVGLYGIKCAPPDLNESFDGIVARFGVRCLPGTSDAIENDRHAALMTSAKNYANRYNWELLHRIRGGEVT